jgi:hypothetical protein
MYKMTVHGLKTNRRGEVFGQKKAKKGIHGMKNGGKTRPYAPHIKRIRKEKRGGIEKSVERM